VDLISATSNKIQSSIYWLIFRVSILSIVLFASPEFSESLLPITAAFLVFFLVAIRKRFQLHFIGYIFAAALWAGVAVFFMIGQHSVLGAALAAFWAIYDWSCSTELKCERN
jgi:hypothetical protein